MKKQFLLITCTIAVSCTNLTNNEYQYIETIETVTLLGEDTVEEEEPIEILAKNDSIAYFKAYTKFVIAEKLEADKKEVGFGNMNEPVSYRLLNSDNIDISKIKILKSDSIKESIRTKIFSGENEYRNLVNAKTENVKEIDSAKVNELKVFFTHKKDEYSSENTEWITPKNSPPYRNSNGIYLYFSKNNLRFVYQYHDEDTWLFINKCQFLIDGKPFQYFPQNLKRDNDHSGITEYFDDKVDSSNKSLIEALSIAKTAKVKLVGDQYYEEKTISKKQLLSIKRTLEYYKALGNQF